MTVEINQSIATSYIPTLMFHTDAETVLLRLSFLFIPIQIGSWRIIVLHSNAIQCEIVIQYRTVGRDAEKDPTSNCWWALYLLTTIWKGFIILEMDWDYRFQKELEVSATQAFAIDFIRLFLFYSILSCYTTA